MKGFKAFDETDWGFFIFIGLCVLALLAMAFVCLFGGAPVPVTVLVFLATAGLSIMYVRVTWYVLRSK